MESGFYMEFFGPQWIYECWSLKVVVVDLFGCCLEMKFLGERCCVPGSDEMFEIHQRSMCFGC
jgi:hypothetical protein